MRLLTKYNLSTTRSTGNGTRPAATAMSSNALPNGVWHALSLFASETIKETIQAMLTTCVGWAKPALVAIAILAVFQIQPDHTVSAQSSDPSFLPRLSLIDLQYMGGFRLPSESSRER